MNTDARFLFLLIGITNVFVASMSSAGPNRRMIHSSRCDRAVVTVCISSALIVWLLQITGVMSDFNGLAYDFFLRSKLRITRPADRVLLTYVEPRSIDEDPEYLTKLSTKLESLGVREQGLIQPSNDLPASLLKRSQAGKIILPFDPSNRVRVNNDPQREMDQRGLIDLFAVQSIYRTHFVKRTTQGNPGESIEAKLARRVLMKSDVLPDGEFQVNFRGTSGSIPHVMAEQVLSDSIVTELTNNRVALIGYSSTYWNPGVVTPTTSRGEAMSLLEFHGQALNTLLTGTAIHTANSGTTLAILICVALISGIATQRFSLRWSALIAFIAMLTSCILTFALLAVISVWIPLISIMLAQLCCCCGIFVLRFRLSDRAVNNLVGDQWRRVRKRRWNSDFFGSEQMWEQLVSFAYQVFYLDRLVILELLPGNDYMSVVQQVNCDEEDISERRRDSRRWPFSAAADSRGPIHLNESGRWFFKPMEQHQQYLVPLSFAGELYGYLALEVASSYLDQFADFLPRVEEFADEIASLLYQRRCVHSEAERTTSRRNNLNHVPEQRVLNEFQRANLLLERRLGRLEDVFDNSSVAAAVFDVFGQPLQLNARLLKLLQKKGLIANEVTAVDLLAALSGRDLNACRQRLRHVIIDKQSSSTILTLDDDSRVFQLSIRPLVLGTSNAAAGIGEAQPFQLQGIHIELVEGTPFFAMNQPKERVTEHLCGVLSHDLDKMNDAAEKLTSDPGNNILQFGETIRENLDDAVETLREFRSFLDSDLFGYPGDGVPLEPESALRAAVDAVHDEVRPHAIKVSIHAPDSPGEVLANPQRLQETFESILEIIATHANSNTEIHVNIEKRIHDVSFSFTTANAEGLIEHLQAAADSQNDHSSRQFAEIRKCVEHWGGRLAVTQTENRGVQLQLILRAFRLSDPPTPRHSNSAQFHQNQPS